jgi:hypothetical protein
MARISRGGRGGREIPGLHDALLAAARRVDDSWHIETGCGCCESVEVLASGQPCMVGGQEIWRAMFDRRYPALWDEFMHDNGWHVVRGDRLTPGDD